ncbi:radical SAM protein [Wukongibacter baidiensis]
MAKYDLKVGYSCNNRCEHCVIEPNVWEIKRKNAELNTDTKIDCNYKELIDCMNSTEFFEADSIVITGGEPTIRKEFMRLLKYIKRNYPEKKIILQTNGRKLKDFISEIRKNDMNIYFVIALHGFEETHNQITKIKSGNPFKETWESIEEIKRAYGSFDNLGRMEIVLSKKNIFEVPDFVEFLYKNDIKDIGISYPHLDGYANIDFRLVKNIGFSYGELRKVIPKFYDLAIKYSDLILSFEEVPKCMWRDEDNNLYKKMPKNITSLNHSLCEDVSVKYPHKTIDSNFNERYRLMHSKVNVCRQCIYDSACLGTWEEAFEVFGGEGFIPVKEYEVEKGGCGECI